MKPAYDVTLKIRVTAPGEIPEGEDPTIWVAEGALLMQDYVEHFVGQRYQRLGAQFQILSSEAKFLEPATTGESA